MAQHAAPHHSAPPEDREAGAPTSHLRRGWTTGACAAAAAKAAYAAFLDLPIPDPVDIPLPRGGRTAFALAASTINPSMAAIVKDAGDDPDVTHGALIRAWITPSLTPGLTFRAGPGVGTVTRPGLPLPPGEPAINPVPRAMIQAAMAELHPIPNATVTIGVDDGEALARQTLNARLGIQGGLSILGTTGVVIPYSCAAWIDTIHRGIDVARAMHLPHIAASTGNTSEVAIAALHALPDVALIEMGDFAGGLLKYLRTHPVPKVSIAGGVAKMTKLAQGRLDLHSKRGTADMPALAAWAPPALQPAIAAATSVAEAFALCPALGTRVAEAAWHTAAQLLQGTGTALEIVVFDRNGTMQGRAGMRPV